jgi:hypothetical protein
MNSSNFESADYSGVWKTNGSETKERAVSECTEVAGVAEYKQHDEPTIFGDM